ncbi:MAG: Ppx/GppA phosphatase family protein [Actinomycetota bacterium]
MDRPGNLAELRGDGDMHAAIDLGTNSFHLLVARLDAEGRFEVLAKEKETVRLGSGSGDMAQLTDDAMDRGIAALQRFRRIADSLEAQVTAVATSALREAANRSVFVERARIEAAIDVQVVPGVEEARLIHLGVIQSLPLFDQQILVVDIGGGSTEFLVGRGREVRSAHSTKLGAIRLTDRFFPNGRIKGDAVADCRTHVRSFLVPTIRRVRELRPFVAVGSSGTINTVARMAIAAAGGDPAAPTNGQVVTRAALGAVVDTVTGLSRADDRKGIPGLDDRRQDIIVAGVLLLEQIFDGLAIEEMTVSEAALREGILLDRAAAEGSPSFHHLSDIRRQSVLRMAEMYHEDIGHIQRATDLALALFDATSEIHQLELDHRDLLEAAGLLHNVGLFISHAAHHKHSYYVIRNSDQLQGFTDGEIELIAQVARYHRKSAPKPTHLEFVALDDARQRIVRSLAGMLRVAIALDRTRQGGIERLDVSIDEGAVTIDVVVDPALDYSLEIYTAGQRRRMLANMLGRDVVIRLASPPEPPPS